MDSEVQKALAAVRDNQPSDMSELPWCGDSCTIIDVNGEEVGEIILFDDAECIRARVNYAPILAAEVGRLQDENSRYVAHLRGDACDECECELCSVRDCAYSEPLHHHHDGCPAACSEGVEECDKATLIAEVERLTAALAAAEAKLSRISQLADTWADRGGYAKGVFAKDLRNVLAGTVGGGQQPMPAPPEPQAVPSSQGGEVSNG